MTWESIAQMTAMLADGQPAQGTLRAKIAQKLLRTTRNGKPYMEVQLVDSESSLMLKVWENMPWYSTLQGAEQESGIAMDGVWCNTQFGIEVSGATVRPLRSEEEEILLVGSVGLQKRQSADWQQILGLVGTIRDPRLVALCDALLSTHEKRFRRAAAARGFHHARRGGLVEHTAGVMRTANALCDAYPHVNRDLVLTGALFHDCGKMWENGYTERGLAMPYTDTGELLGHISLGIEVINKLWSGVCTEARRNEWEKLKPPTEQVRLHLLHLVASHHGTLEFGSPVVPKTPEAFVLHHADDLDAKMEMLRNAYAESPQLSEHIRQRRMPLPGNVVDSLPKVGGDGEEA